MTTTADALRTLRTLPALTAHVLAQYGGLRAKQDGTAGTVWEAPMPLNAQAFDDANDLWEALVAAVEYEAAWLQQELPAAARNAYRRADGALFGFAAGTSPRRALEDVGALSTWVTDRLHLLEEHALDALIVVVREVAGRYPIDGRPRTSRTAVCPGDRGALLVCPPRHYGDTQLIACQSCGRKLTEDEYAATERRFAAVQAHEAALARSKRVGARLALKYAVTA